MKVRQFQLKMLEISYKIQQQTQHLSKFLQIHGFITQVVDIFLKDSHLTVQVPLLPSQKLIDLV